MINDSFFIRSGKLNIEIKFERHVYIIELFLWKLFLYIKILYSMIQLILFMTIC